VHISGFYYCSNIR